MKTISIATVAKASRISPNMIRVRLHSEAIKSFPNDCTGGHIKLVIPPANHELHQFHTFLGSSNVRMQMRTYTIRHIDSVAGEIDIDFVAHGDTGPACAWAQSAQTGDFIGMSTSPGWSKLKNASSGNYLIAVDMTAFPAAAASVEKLPADAKGDFFTEILSKDDMQPINAPTGIKMHWIVHKKSRDGDAFTQTIKALDLAGNESIFIAGEYTPVAELKSYFRTQQAYPREQLYISSYWKQGLIESQHKRVKAFVA